MNFAPAKILRDWNGIPLSKADLPAIGKRVHWTAARKAKLLLAIDGGIISEQDAGSIYALSHEEIESWRAGFTYEGVDGLKALRGRK